MKMHVVIAAAVVTVVTATPVFAQDMAQEPGGENAGGYVSGLGGFASSVANTTGDFRAEAGVRVAPHVMVFGMAGRLTDLQAELQPTLAQTTSIAATQGLTVIGGGTMPTSYFGGGVRVEFPTHSRVMPYALGALSMAHLSPAPLYTFSNGRLPNGSVPVVGTDITPVIAAANGYVTPLPSNAPMFTLGGGAQYLVAPHWAIDAGYRYSRIAASDTLNTTALTTNGLTFGAAYRF